MTTRSTLLILLISFMGFGSGPCSGGDRSACEFACYRYQECIHEICNQAAVKENVTVDLIESKLPENLANIANADCFKICYQDQGGTLGISGSECEIFSANCSAMWECSHGAGYGQEIINKMFPNHDGGIYDAEVMKDGDNNTAD